MSYPLTSIGPRDASITTTLNLDNFYRLGKGLRRSVLGFLRSRSHTLVLSSALNTRENVEGIVYQIFKVSAIRLIAHFERTQMCLIKRNRKFLSTTIQDAISFGSRLFLNSMKRKLKVNLSQLDFKEAAVVSMTSSFDDKFDFSFKEVN